MRTTLDIEADVLAAAKELAQRQGVSAGKVVSSLLRSALTGKGASPAIWRCGCGRIPSLCGQRSTANEQ